MFSVVLQLEMPGTPFSPLQPQLLNEDFQAIVNSPQILKSLGSTQKFHSQGPSVLMRLGFYHGRMESSNMLIDV